MHLLSFARQQAVGKSPLCNYLFIAAIHILTGYFSPKLLSTEQHTALTVFVLAWLCVHETFDNSLSN